MDFTIWKVELKKIVDFLTHPNTYIYTFHKQLHWFSYFLLKKWTVSMICKNDIF